MGQEGLRVRREPPGLGGGHLGLGFSITLAPSVSEELLLSAVGILLIVLFIILMILLKILHDCGNSHKMSFSAKDHVRGSSSAASDPQKSPAKYH